jgi:probable O-glycosylation ligase (exosortase A-associated)
MMVINNRIRIHALVWAIVLGISYYSVKGGVYIMLGGRGQISTFAGGDNNTAAAAMITMWPFLYYLRLHSADKNIRRGLVAAMVFSILGILGTTSRGGALALAAVLSYFWWQSKHKAVIAICGAVGLVAVLQVMPQQWIDKMNSIQNYNEVESAQTRFESWHVALQMAMERPLTGGGMEAITQYRLTAKYDPDRRGFEAHSIWFQMLSDHGFPGLALFILINLVSWRNAAGVRKIARTRPELAWAADLATMGQLSMVGFLAAGSLLSMAYYDAYYTVLAVLAVMRASVAGWANVAARQQAADSLLNDGDFGRRPALPAR